MEMSDHESLKLKFSLVCGQNTTIWSKRKKLLINARAWIGLRCSRLCERSQSHYARIPSRETQEHVKLICGETLEQWLLGTGHGGEHGLAGRPMKKLSEVMECVIF